MTQRMLRNVVRLAVAALLAVVWIRGGTLVNAQQLPPPGQLLTPNQLDDMVAPIALYPDPLVSQILVAATYPLEVVEASQWLQRNPSLTGKDLSQAAERQDWDPSIQALVPFADVLKYLTEDIAWTTSLGNAFLAQEADVMDAIQRMRARAAQDGKLVSTSQQVVTRTYDSGRPIYVITPAEPEVIYVPVYDPYWVWGPPVYYPYARWYYPPHYPAVYFNPGISVSFFYGSAWQGWGNWGWRPHWNDRTVIVNNTFINRQHINTTRVTTFTGNTTWSHDGRHRQGVPYPTRVLTDRFRPSVRDNVVSREVGQVRSGPAQTVSTGRRDTSPNATNRDFNRGTNNDAPGSRNDRGNSSGTMGRQGSNSTPIASPRTVTPTPQPANGAQTPRVAPPIARTEPVRSPAQQERPAQDRSAQERLAQAPSPQARLTQDRSVQERVAQRPSPQDRLAEARPAQDRAVQERLAQGRPAQERLAQGPPAQVRPVQERPAQERPAFREPAQNRAPSVAVQSAQPVARQSVQVHESSSVRSAPESSQSHGNGNGNNGAQSHGNSGGSNSRGRR